MALLKVIDITRYGGNMQLKLGTEIYDIEIVKKISNKNTYLRVKEDLTIYVTTNIFISNKEIERFILKNQDSIEKMVNKIKRRNEKADNFYYLGKKYDIVYTNSREIILGEEKVFMPRDINLEIWYKKEASKLYKERLDYWYERFTEKIPYPTLTLRKMKSRWGVCNTRDKRVTLNLELMKKEVICLDYVIVHELSHLIHADHSSRFWKLVEQNFKDYKLVRKILKD